MIEIAASETVTPGPARRRGPVRAVDPRLCSAFRVLMEGRHQGRDQAATWEAITAELEAEGVHVPNVRRIQECAAHLRRVEKVAVLGDSQVGVYVVRDDEEKRIALSERVKRIRSLAKDIEALDRALYERIAGALPLEERVA